MAGIVISQDDLHYADNRSALPDIDDAIAAQIIRWDYAERQCSTIAEGMRAMGKISVPSNINVWTHTKGTSALQTAAEGLAEAAKLIASR